jgi:hypothetical protein
MRMKQDRQPRRASKDLPVDKLHPASDMGRRAKGGDKFSSGDLPRRMNSGDQTSVADSAKPKKH